MKNRFFSKYVLLSVLGGSCLLSSCHSNLYRAAERGDITAVRREIAYANTLSESEKEEHLSGEPSSANLLWIIPTALITIPLDLPLIMLSAGNYPTSDNSLTDLAWARFWGGRYSTAVRASYCNNHDDITYELMEAGAPTPDFIKDWMHKNYWRYKTPAPTIQIVEDTPSPTPKPVSPKPREDSSSLPGRNITPGQ
ncbi:MAG: hypothetical protein Q4F40_05615 [Akkermansia sp.]|nr:hypothetical protein [Akkermansia sp.]